MDNLHAIILIIGIITSSVAIGYWIGNHFRDGEMKRPITWTLCAISTLGLVLYFLI